MIKSKQSIFSKPIEQIYHYNVTFHTHTIYKASVKVFVKSNIQQGCSYEHQELSTLIKAIHQAAHRDTGKEAAEPGRKQTCGAS